MLEKVQLDVGNKIPRSVKLIKSSHGSLPAEVLLGLDSASETDVHNRKSHHELEPDTNSYIELEPELDIEQSEYEPEPVDPRIQAADIIG